MIETADLHQKQDLGADLLYLMTEDEQEAGVDEGDEGTVLLIEVS